MRRWILGLAAAVVGLAVWQSPARAGDTNLPRFYYYPYYYYPHSYWPQNSAQWPETPGAPYMRPPAYMAYPPFLEKHWRYDLFKPHKYHSGHHFWLDQF